MYVAEELWSLCWTDVLLQYRCLRTKKNVQKIKCRNI